MLEDGAGNKKNITAERLSNTNKLQKIWRKKSTKVLMPKKHAMVEKRRYRVLYTWWPHCHAMLRLIQSSAIVLRLSFQVCRLWASSPMTHSYFSLKMKVSDSSAWLCATSEHEMKPAVVKWTSLWSFSETPAVFDDSHTEPFPSSSDPLSQSFQTKQNQLLHSRY